MDSYTKRRKRDGNANSNYTFFLQYLHQHRFSLCRDATLDSMQIPFNVLIKQNPNRPHGSNTSSGICSPNFWEMPRQTRNQSYKVCFCFRRIFKLRVLEPPEDIKNLFQLYSQNGIMGADDLQRFLVEIQGEEDATKEDAQNIFNHLKHLNIFQRKGFHLEAFFRYLLNDLNGPLPPSPKVHQDMTAPLAHYFMFTGHNSYLIGNQVNSDCSVEPIIKALQRGVRVIELDLWPNSEGDDVEVCHGGLKTFTAPVDFLQCLEAIKEHAFVVSEYPVVITFEDHLNPFLRSKVAQMVNETFGKMLFRPESDHFEKLYSPERLKNKILISTKPPNEYLDSKSDKVMESPKLTKASKNEQWKDEQTSSKSEPETHDKEEKIGEEHLPEEDEEKTVSEYKKIIAIHAGKLKGDLINLLHDAKEVKRFSINEQELEIATKKYATEIVRFTQRNILRVYPKGLRVDSSNYNPFVGWMHGAQMVAFNMQGYGKHLWIMQGMFRANGGCGYVKKPDFLLHPISESFHLYRNLKTYLQVKVYMGEGWDLDFRRTHFDLYSPPDFFIKVGIAGVPADEAKWQTKVIEDDWLPEWNEECGFWLTVPELAVLRIEAKEYDTTGTAGFAGQTCLPVSELRTGIRVVPLHDRRGDKYKNVKLLMEFSIN